MLGFQVTWNWVVSHSQITRMSIVKILCHWCYEANVSIWEFFQGWLVTDSPPCRMTYEAPQCITTNLQGTYDRKKIQPRVGLRRSKSTSYMIVIDGWNGHRSSRFKSSTPSYCEYFGVTYDLLVSNIRGTYDLADQLLSNCHFGHLLLVSQAQVPRELHLFLLWEKINTFHHTLFYMQQQPAHGLQLHVINNHRLQ